MIYARKNDVIDVATKMMSWTANTSCASYLSTHDIDLVFWFLNTRVRSVFAKGVKRILTTLGVNTYDAIQAMVTFENGAIGTFESCWLLPNTMPSATDSYLHLIGSEGTIRVNRETEGLTLADSSTYTNPRLSLYQKIQDKYKGGIPYCLEYYIDCVQNHVNPQPDVLHGFHIVKISKAIHDSINKNEEITIV